MNWQTVLIQKMFLVLIFIFIPQGFGLLETSPEDCVVTPFSGQVRDFTDVLVVGFGPLSDESLPIQATLSSENSPPETISLTPGTSYHSTLSKEQHFSWNKTLKWDLLQLELSKENADDEAASSKLLVTAGDQSMTSKSQLKPPVRVSLGDSEKVKVFFNCPLECQINNEELDEIPGRTTFYLWREEDFNKAEIYIAELQRVVTVLPEQVPDRRHWYEIDVQGGYRSIQVLIDGVPQVPVSTPHVIPHFTKMRVTIPGSTKGLTKVSWCSQDLLLRPDPGHRTAAVVLLVLLIFVNILAFSLRKKMKLEIEEIQKSRGAQQPVAFRNLPHILAENSTPPPAPPPLMRKVKMDEHYSDPHDSLSKEYADLSDEPHNGETKRDELRQNSVSVHSEFTQDCTYGIGVHRNKLDGERGETLPGVLNPDTDPSTEDPYFDKPFHPLRQPIGESQGNATIISDDSPYAISFTKPEAGETANDHFEDAYDKLNFTEEDM